MSRASNIAATGMHASELQVSVIAHNLANASTTGYKARNIAFSDLLYQKDTRAGTVSDQAGNIIPVGIEIGLGVKPAGIYRINHQGPLKETFNPYDLAINGNGHFRVEMPDGSFAYTRDGSFRISPNYEIVTDQGLVVTPGIIIPPNVEAGGVTINSDGQVSALIQGSITPQILGQIDLVDFPNANGLSSVGDNLLLETSASGGPIVSVANTDGMGSIKQGWIESSNVNSITDITDLITANRTYELCSKAIKTDEEMSQTVSRMKS